MADTINLDDLLPPEDAKRCRVKREKKSNSRCFAAKQRVANQKAAKDFCALLAALDKETTGAPLRIRTLWLRHVCECGEVYLAPRYSGTSQFVEFDRGDHTQLVALPHPNAHPTIPREEIEYETRLLDTCPQCFHHKDQRTLPLPLDERNHIAHDFHKARLDCLDERDYDKEAYDKDRKTSPPKRDVHELSKNETVDLMEETLPTLPPTSAQGEGL